MLTKNLLELYIIIEDPPPPSEYWLYLFQIDCHNDAKRGNWV